MQAHSKDSISVTIVVIINQYEESKRKKGAFQFNRPGRSAPQAVWVWVWSSAQESGLDINLELKRTEKLY